MDPSKAPQVSDMAATAIATVAAHAKRAVAEDWDPQSATGASSKLVPSRVRGGKRGNNYAAKMAAVAKRASLSVMGQYLLIAPAKIMADARRIAVLRTQERDIGLSITRHIDRIRRSFPLDYLYEHLGQFGAEPAVIKERLAVSMAVIVRFLEKQVLRSTLKRWWDQTRKERGVDFRRGCAARLLKETLLVMVHELKARGFGRWLVVTSVERHLQRTRATIDIQRIWKGFIGRIYFVRSYYLYFQHFTIHSMFFSTDHSDFPTYHRSD